MGELIGLGKFKKREFTKNDFFKKSSIIQTIKLLHLYQIFLIDMDILFSVVSKNKSVEELTVFYLNSILKKRLGKKFVLEGESEEVLRKFRGIHLFKNEKKEAFSWSIKGVNFGKFKSLKQAWEKIERNSNLGGELFFIKNFKGECFLIDPMCKNFRKGDYRIGRCWSYQDGKVFFCISYKNINYFIVDKGQGPFKALKEFKEKF